MPTARYAPGRQQATGTIATEEGISPEYWVQAPEWIHGKKENFFPIESPQFIDGNSLMTDD